jgi:chromosome segregation protein
LHLKSITVKGFKSFPDRTRLEFGPGVSVIVGPNGSGKSNVTDAVLWALGEQSPGNVRGQSMQDVIFAGAPGRQAAGQAEVELVLDDNEGTLALGAPELSIYRKLDRTGEGEYRLAGARCRLVDVVELLSDTGLGKEMHSVISQGRVESIVTSKPRDRRLLIEEAAGLGKHRKRRRRAQLKLARTQDNLDRALDIEREARSRLRPLKRQAEAAELHARLERQTLEIRWELSRDSVRGHRARLAQARQAAEEVRTRRAALQSELEAVARRREAAEEALAARSATREELSRRSYAARGAAERVRDRVSTVKSAASTIRGRLGRTQELVSALRQAAQDDLPDTDAQSRIAALEDALAALDRDRELELARQLQELERQRAQAADALSEHSRSVQRSLTQREDAEARTQEARAVVRQAERGAQAARSQAAQVGAELAGVNQFLRHQAVSPNGARPLADQLEVDPGYELALAAAFDGRLRAVVVEHRRAGAELLDRIGSEGGRALVTDGFDREPGGSAEPRTPGPFGAEPLIDHVHGPEPALALARTLLRDTWVVSDLQTLEAGFRGVAVTKSGRVWSAPTRELRQAPAVGEDRVLAERNRRERLVAASEAAAQAELEARAALERASSESARVETARDDLVAAHRDSVRVQDDVAEQLRRIEAQIARRRAAPDDGAAAGRRSQLTAELAAERQMLARAERERSERAGRIQRLDAAALRDRELLPTIAALTAALEDAAAAISEQLSSFEAALVADRQAGETVAGELRSCAQQEAALHARLGGENEALTESEVRVQRASDQEAEARAELQQLAQRLQLDAGPAERELSDEERESLDARLQRLARRREQIGPVNPLAQEQYTDALAHVEELERQREDLEAALAELEKLIADTDRQIRATFEQTFAATSSGFEEVVTDLFPGGSGRLRLVAERRGPARVIGGQSPPPDTDESEEEDATSPDEQEEEEEDLLGVEIEITPAGKECKRLSLLSGGEKSLTALAFLFAVFLARPCPFYILDEVEAALDDLNIDRFLALLRRYSSRAQFIVVTHQKRTMDAADSLYGVSMGADGISKVVSQRLVDAQAA